METFTVLVSGSGNTPYVAGTGLKPVDAARMLIHIGEGSDTRFPKKGVQVMLRHDGSNENISTDEFLERHWSNFK